MRSLNCVTIIAVCIISSPLSINVGAFSQPSSDWPSHTSQHAPKQQQTSSSFITNNQPPPLPETNDAYTLLGFDYMSPPKDFTLVHRAYRNLARRYHHDVIAGPDATVEEREQANVNFVRINEAYEDLKARKDEEEIEVVIMGSNFATGKR